MNSSVRPFAPELLNAIPQPPQKPPVAGRQKLLLYAEHFGLTGQPFSLLPDPNYLFWSTIHTRAYAMLEYGLATFAPITVITGEVGAGKTTLVCHLLNTALPDLTIGLVSNAHGERGKLLHWVMAALGQPIVHAFPYVQRFERFKAFLWDEHNAGRHVVLIFDEAQNLSANMLEELRCLSNLNSEEAELLQIILVGQPELNEVIGSRQMVQFAQRVAAQFHLSAMPQDAVRDYVGHRMRIAGASREIFTPEACDLIFQASGGIPRVINQICDYALVYAFAEDLREVGPRLIEDVIADRRAQQVNRQGRGAPPAGEA